MVLTGMGMVSENLTHNIPVANPSHLRETTNLPGFTETASVGVALETFELSPVIDSVESDVEHAKNDMSGHQIQVENSQEQLNLQEEEEETLKNALIDILTITMDHISMNK